ncbi:MAG: T9SS type A sorting domain-containing protein, partial [Bacteroidota bacterium]
TAFTVVIIDTLDAQVLDLSTLQTGISSHPYRMSLRNNVLEFAFDNILLPDSSTNEPASNGFVHFTIDQLPNLSDGTLIENEAAIYFDFNEPIITNVSRHLITQKVLTTQTHNYELAGDPIVVTPVPATEWLQFTRVDWPEKVSLIIYDFLGRPVVQQRLPQSGTRITIGQLPSGQYGYRLTSDGQLVQSGVISKQ